MTTGVLVTPPELPVIITIPGATPVSSPLLSIVAMLEALQAHCTAALAITLPLVSFTTAENCNVEPLFTVFDGAEIVTLPTFGSTVKVTAELVTPSALAVICVLPVETACASPDVSMLATLPELLAHVRVPPDNTFPLESFTDRKRDGRRAQRDGGN
jgi:hypothetical protein